VETASLRGLLARDRVMRELSSCHHCTCGVIVKPIKHVVQMCPPTPRYTIRLISPLESQLTSIFTGIRRHLTAVGLNPSPARRSISLPRIDSLLLSIAADIRCLNSYKHPESPTVLSTSQHPPTDPNASHVEKKQVTEPVPPPPLEAATVHNSSTETTLSSCPPPALTFQQLDTLQSIRSSSDPVVPQPIEPTSVPNSHRQQLVQPTSHVQPATVTASPLQQHTTTLFTRDSEPVPLPARIVTPPPPEPTQFSVQTDTTPAQLSPAQTDALVILPKQPSSPMAELPTSSSTRDQVAKDIQTSTRFPRRLDAMLERLRSSAIEHKKHMDQLRRETAATIARAFPPLPLNWLCYPA